MRHVGRVALAAACAAMMTAPLAARPRAMSRIAAANRVVEPPVSATQALRPAEQIFVEKALESSRQQMRLADIGTNQANSADVRAHASQLAADYRELSETLEALVRRKGGVAGAPTGGSSETFQKLATRSGADFDREFVRLSSGLSESVMNLFQQAANNTKDPDLRAFVSGQLPLLRAHRNRDVELKKAVE